MHTILKWFLIGGGTLFFVVSVQAQEKKKKENVFLHPDKFYAKYLPNIKITYKPSDSTYIKTYPKNYMTIALHMLSPTIYANLSPGGASQAASDYRTNVKTITGFSFSYRHVTAGFALSLLPPLGDPPGYGDTRYRTATIKYKSPIYILTFRFMKIKGMTDANAFNSLDPMQQTVYRSDIIIKEYEFEGIYNFNWKKYSYLSTIDYTEGQIKSHLGFMVKAGVYSQQFYSDSNLLSMPQRPYFRSFDDITRMNGFNIKLSPGAGGNLVIKKHFYMSFAVFSPVNLYINRLFTTEGIAHKETNFQLVLDGSVSMGYQTKRFYAALRYEIDGRTAVMNTFQYTSVYRYIGLDIGYRFQAPGVVKKFYKDTMPPGM